MGLFQCLHFRYLLLSLKLARESLSPLFPPFLESLWTSESLSTFPRSLSRQPVSSIPYFVYILQLVKLLAHSPWFSFLLAWTPIRLNIQLASLYVKKVGCQQPYTVDQMLSKNISVNAWTSGWGESYETLNEKPSWRQYSSSGCFGSFGDSKETVIKWKVLNIYRQRPPIPTPSGAIFDNVIRHKIVSRGLVSNSSCSWTEKEFVFSQQLYC